MTLMVTMVTIAISSALIGLFLRTLLPKYRSAHQGASWREALQGAEAGVNHGINELNELAGKQGNTSSYPWAEKGWSLADAAFSLNGERLLNEALLPLLGGSSGVSVSKLTMDVYTRQATAPYHPWFRIRSTGRAELPDRYTSDDRRDARLRRMKLAALTSGRSAPYVERTVEVIVKPRLRFSRALTTVGELSLGTSSWRIDSFDSADAGKSDPGTAAGGVFPADLSRRGANAHIASALSRPADSPFGELIRGNSARVEGNVQTAGGDDPRTEARENVSGSSGMDLSRIADDFDEDITPAPRPVWTLPLPAPLGNTNFLPGAETLPLRYVVSGNLGAFRVLSATPGTTGTIEIMVNGNLDLTATNNPEIVIPPNVKTTLYVKGDIHLGNGKVNFGNSSSKVAGNLTVFGISGSAQPRFTTGSGARLALAFYGPSYAMTMDSSAVTVGAIVAKSFAVNGAGGGGFHYDETLGRTSDITGWSVVSYFEDTRAR
jgi:hypothetical protein